MVIENTALWVCDHGAENLARYCAEGDAAIYASYLKTLDFVVDFAVKHGVCGALNKKLATANGYSARQFNLNKPREFRSGKTSGGAKYRKVTGHKERIVSTPQMQADFIQRMKTERDWRLKGKINNQHAYYCAKDGLYYVPVRGEKNDIEVWRVSGKRAVHQGAIECNTGRLYEGPKHKDAKFE